MISDQRTAPTDRAASLRPAFAGAAATFSGLGLARFAYVPLFPAMVAAGWVSGAEAGLLGAANFGGYLVGVLGGRSIGRSIGTRSALTLGMALLVASFAGCAWNGGIAWLAAWRALAGAAGGVLMVLAGPAVQGAVAAGRRGFAGGIVISGVGAGAVAGALLAPALLPSGVAHVWLAMAILVGALLAFARLAWPATPVPRPSRATIPGANVLAIGYGLSAAGLVPHMVYFGDLVVRGRGLDPAYGSVAWLLFGLGALLGPLAAGHAADRWGAARCFNLWLGFQVVALGLALAPQAAPVLAAACLGGFASIGLTAVTLARARDLAGPNSGAVWARTTAAFAIFQAVASLGLAALFARTGSHDALFAVGLALSLTAFLPAAFHRAAEPRMR